MAAAAVLSGGWSWQAAAAWPSIPAPAPRNAAASKTSAAATATVTWTLPESGRQRISGASSGVPGGGGLGVPDRLPAASPDHGDREVISDLAAPARRSDDLADLHRDDHRAGGEAADPLAGHGPGRRLAAAVALGEDPGGPRGLGAGAVELAGGHGAQPGEPGGGRLVIGPGGVGGGEPGGQARGSLDPGGGGPAESRPP